ncbi:GNAT family N-acetyltransferase [Halomonas sp. M5N1S17]|uniref:tRNA(Met) cytidine acetyltransferase TmcA n=1 Tax=Halomonas alkalisoli TaxID=2907158 RepID=UPI001F29344B|nr:GNAT family N-acetyltransferase [Halomonas alkalisoli]MCE9664554.1 GNAT family N-acetyltransferase [Halomonas alkalisoli]
MAKLGWRGLAWISGGVEEAQERADDIWEQGSWQAPCWVAAERPPGCDAAQWLSPTMARSHLGGEHDLVVFDTVTADAGFDPDAFGALSGTLRAGGLLLLLTPVDWGGPRAESPAGPYLSRLRRRLEADGAVAHWRAGSTPVLPEWPGAEPAKTTPVADPDCLTADQVEAVSRLVRLKRRRPLVLTADRGRGKTAALGISCARLLAAGEREILVTAPRPAAVSALFERLASLCPEGERQGNDFVDGRGGRVAFVAPDTLSSMAERGEAGGSGSRLLVDEAAAIPAGLLGQWLEAFPRIAFATTVHGYEGSGRGFALRFRARLQRQAPDWHELHLAAPVRWAEGDPLERLVSDLLLLDAEPPIAAPATTALVEKAWPRDRLATDEAALRDLFGLLVQAHYRTTPGDLRRLLDEPGLRVSTLDAAGQAQGVIVQGDEGGFDSELAERVARGERRPPGHLLAQSLAAHAGSREALMARLRRVQRIAVHPARRREGLGRRLIDSALAEARRDGVDLLGASFGAESGLMAFWQAQGFRTVRLGLSRETATGEHALMVLAPTSERGEALATELTAGFQRLLPALLAFELKSLDPAVALTLLAEGPRPVLDAGDRRDIDDVAFGYREPALVRPALQALLRQAAIDRCGDPALVWLVAWAFQGRDMRWMATNLKVAGRRSVMEQLRKAVARLIEGQVAQG